MLKVEMLSASYGSDLPDVLTNVSFSLEKGNVLNVLGQNAVGKTTLIRCLTRELSSYKGRILVHNKDARSYSVVEYSRLIGVVSASFLTYQNLTVADYLVTGFVNQTTSFSRPTRKMVEEAFAVLARFNKQDLFNKQIDQLSSGEKQLVMISRVIIQNPEIIVFDEPTANLDVKNQIAVLGQIQQLSSLGYTVVVTTHNPGHAMTLGGKTLLMGKSKYIYGNTREIINSYNLSEYYGLSARMIEESDFQCIVFNSDSTGSINLVF